MSSLYTTIVDCVGKGDFDTLDALISVTPISDIPISNLMSSLGVIRLLDIDLPSRDSFYESALEDLESRGLDRAALTYEIEKGYCQ